MCMVSCDSVGMNQVVFADYLASIQWTRDILSIATGSATCHDFKKGQDAGESVPVTLYCAETTECKLFSVSTKAREY
jgi:hypothetical protein